MDLTQEQVEAVKACGCAFLPATGVQVARLSMQRRIFRIDGSPFVATRDGGGFFETYAAHKHPKVMRWLGRHPRFVLHFTPTSASWLNAVEGFFAKLTRQRLKRGVFKGIVDLQATINRFLAETNDNPKPFTWTADPDAIIEKVRRGKQALESIHSHVRRFK